MFPWIGAASAGLSLLNSVLQATTASATKKVGSTPSSLAQALTGTGNEATTAVAGSGKGAPALSDGTLATLISLQGKDGSGSPGRLFSKLDTNGNGGISKIEFENALSKAGVDTSSADALFGKLDTDGDGSISQGEFAKAAGRHHHHAGGKGGPSDLLNSSDLTGASSKTTSNADGSSTTTITYQDGSTVTMTTPASGGASGGTSKANMMERLIKLQAQLTAHNSASTAAVA